MKHFLFKKTLKLFSGFAGRSFWDNSMEDCNTCVKMMWSQTRMSLSHPETQLHQCSVISVQSHTLLSMCLLIIVLSEFEPRKLGGFSVRHMLPYWISDLFLASRMRIGNFQMCTRRNCPITILRGAFLTIWPDNRNRRVLIKTRGQLSDHFLHLLVPRLRFSEFVSVTELWSEVSLSFSNNFPLAFSDTLHFSSAFCPLLLHVSIGSLTLLGSQI